MQPAPEQLNKRKGTIFWLLLFGILCCQLVSIVKIHSIVGHLTIWDTLLFLIIRIDESPFIGKWFRQQNMNFQTLTVFLKSQPGHYLEVEYTQHVLYHFIPTRPTNSPKVPFLHVVGCICVEALLFVAFLHSMESAFCDESNSGLSITFLAITLVNALIKLSTMAHFRIELLKVMHQCVIHLLVPAGLLILFIVNHLYSMDDAYYLSRLDPWLGMVLCTFISLIIVPVFLHYLPCLLCHNPDGINIEKFKAEIETQFPRTKCLHLHVFRAYPNNSFNVIMHISIDLTNPPSVPADEILSLNDDSTTKILNGVPHKWAFNQVNEVLFELQRVLHKAGANSVTIQPHIRVTSGKLEFNKTEWKICKTEHCSTNHSCCTPKKSNKHI